MKKRLLWLFLVLVASTFLYGSDVLIKNVLVYDGGGKKPFKADVRVKGDRIAAIGKNLAAQPNEVVRDEHGLALAPGFIASHHARANNSAELVASEKLARKKVGPAANVPVRFG